MKRLLSLLVVLSLCSVAFLSSCAARPAEKDYIVVAYVTSWSRVMPDPAVMTHINYAFGHVNDTFDGVRVDNPDRLRQIAALKKENPDLKVLISYLKFLQESQHLQMQVPKSANTLVILQQPHQASA